jgi:hypothetical protein
MATGRCCAAVLFGLVLAVAAETRDAKACGAAYPGGPMVCTMADAPSSARARQAGPAARVAGSWAFTSTTILFGEGRRAELTRHAFFVGTEVPLRPGLGLRFGAGGIAAGELVLKAGRAATLGPGVTGFVGISKTVLEEAGARPFVQVGATLSVSRAATRETGGRDAPSFTALDVRAAATAGTTLLDGWVVPYVSARAFGGPIFYRYAGQDVTGTDLYKYQLAGGLSLARASRMLDVFIEGVPLGERGVSAGVGATF